MKCVIKNNVWQRMMIKNMHYTQKINGNNKNSWQNIAKIIEWNQQKTNFK